MPTFWLVGWLDLVGWLGWSTHLVGMVGWILLVGWLDLVGWILTHDKMSGVICERQYPQEK